MIGHQGEGVKGKCTSSSKGFWYESGCAKYVSPTGRNVIPSFEHVVDSLASECITAVSEQLTRWNHQWGGVKVDCEKIFLAK